MCPANVRRRTPSQSSPADWGRGRRRRTDIDAPIHYRKNKHVLYGQQEGQCRGCRMDFPFKAFEIDHVVPRSKGGTDHLDNLQLLCSHCNRIKGDRDQAYLMARLKETVYA